MANIIEQQDLLKGLPDARLSLLLQKPDASIPPFLVAAEAQRRQSIRQQFSGGTNESVVDTLTKQMANVPQNIQAPMQTPPQLPQPQMQPQMGGIGALPQAPQGMASGGPVRRFANGTLVTPTVSDLASGITSLTPAEYARRMKEEKIKNLEPGKARFLLENPTIPKTEAQQAEDAFRAATEGPFSGFYTPEGVYEAAQSLVDVNKRTATPPPKPVEPDTATTTTPESKPPSSTTGTDDTSTENKYKAMEAEMRKRLEGLYGAEEPSNWENAQKWFAMSQQIMNPDATLMQGLVNAGAVFADISGDQAAEQRQADRAREEALLNWDMQIMQGDRANEAAAATRAAEQAWEREKLGMLGSGTIAEIYLEQLKTLSKEMTDTIDPNEKESLRQQINGLQTRLAQLTKSGGPGGGAVVGRAEYDALNLGAR